ncbi:Leucine-rich repeat transmembrane protein kinase [Prunus dulcis]|uniref:non-specific serine/threonine protein kinase n=1 Tax=Prunus dulcis TaxID=3755 RepID=A0A4Y1RAN4_PRUDU|nr:Leucine-rich repeat transmembrane protein kinase [Prunus dulcis]
MIDSRRMLKQPWIFQCPLPSFPACASGFRISSLGTIDNNMINLRRMLKQPWPLSAFFCSLCFLSCFWFQVSMAQNATTDPSEVTALLSIFRQWDMQALPIRGGEPCIGFAINGSEFEKPENNPASSSCSEQTRMFPKEFEALRYLAVLKLDHNYFTGPLPAFIGNMSVSHNSFSGPIPKELGNLKELFMLYMDSCGLGGEIPSTFAKLINMKELYASDNPVSGKIPSFIGNWRNLTSLRFQGNSFEGPIPTSFSQLTSLESIVLRNTLINGSIPTDFGEYQRLKILDLGFNNLTGQLPSSLFNMSSLTYLNLVVNNFTFDSSNITLPGLNCLQRNFPCNRNTPRYTNFSIKCGGPQMRGNDGILYEAEDSALGPATFNVNSTQNWAVSNAASLRCRLTPELFQTSRVSPGSLRYYGLGLQNGPYTVTLQFAETVFASRYTNFAKSRKAWEPRRKDFDISKEAGGVKEQLRDPSRSTPTTPGKKSRTGLIFYICGEKHQKKMTMKGTLSDGRVVAVKQLSVASHQGKSQFVTEIATISAVQHRNLVKLYGCCIEGSHCILVYEHLENKSLDQALFGRNDLHLDWPTRFNILLGTARGLAYLHEETLPKNIDFGWAKLYDDKKTHMSTRVAGTIGYLAPEYAMRGRLTEKADVFGFGLLLWRSSAGDQILTTTWILRRFIFLNGHGLYMKTTRVWGWWIQIDRIDKSSSPLHSGFTNDEAIDVTCGAILSGDIEASTVMSKPSYLADWDFKDVPQVAFWWMMIPHQLRAMFSSTIS